MKKMGFTTKYLEDGTVKGILNLKEEEQGIQCTEQKTITETQTQQERKLAEPLHE